MIDISRNKKEGQVEPAASITKVCFRHASMRSGKVSFIWLALGSGHLTRDPESRITCMRVCHAGQTCSMMFCNCAGGVSFVCSAAISSTRSEHAQVLLMSSIAIPGNKHAQAVITPQLPYRAVDMHKL